MNNIAHFIHAGGFVMYPLLLLSVAAGIVIVERLLAFRQFGDLSPGLLDQAIKLCRAGRFDEALRACRQRSGPLAASLAAIIEHRNQPVREVERIVEEIGQDYFIKLERLLPVIDTTTTISPLLGLLGTIIGMVGTFQAIAAQQGKGNNDAVLNGVGEALYATATGITIAVICFMAYNYFAARLRTVTAETEQAATKLLNALTEIHHQERAAHNSTGIGREEADRGVQTAARA
ncbi:MAG TPA: MotA/TolQ/ExbB proton channel family protein [Chthonomonadaceae bacterium]|nr:MotA/TolQ/ExbB proton channel family protein [Chthonomonadaceae bacterium]